MTGFLVRTDNSGLLKEIYWSEPVSLVTPTDTSIHAIIDQKVSHESFSSLLNNPAMVKHHSKIHLKRSATHMHCSVVSLDGQHLVYAAESVPILSEDCIHLMVVLLEKSLDSDLGNTEMVNHFDQIQKLNNELMNTQRQLHKANAQLKRLNEDLNNRLVKDVLTGLTSRYQYRSEIERIIGAAPDGMGMFCFIDLDDFKSVNDRYGHAVGDEYLIEFARRMRSMASQYPILHIRIAGDEFGMYLHDLDSIEPEFLEDFWNGFRSTVISHPIPTTAGDLDVACCMGMAFYGVDTFDIFTLIEYADFAMYCAKRTGKATYRTFDLPTYEVAKGKVGSVIH
jgi:diguanylate cyclase (GGDEF)-like protein